ncbi:MAG: hypothetical protein QXG00_07695 [Candidatus Woesearchaeota archaeon]
MKSIFSCLFVIIIFSFLIGCEKNNKNSVTQKSYEISEADVEGLYTGRGLYNAADATIELYYGGSFEMEDPFLPDGGPAFGKWALRGNSIEFYMDGQNIFSAKISINKKNKTINNSYNGKDEKFEVRGIIINGQLWRKVR